MVRADNLTSHPLRLPRLDHDGGGLEVSSYFCEPESGTPMKSETSATLSWYRYSQALIIGPFSRPSMVCRSPFVKLTTLILDAGASLVYVVFLVIKMKLVVNIIFIAYKTVINVGQCNPGVR